MGRVEAERTRQSKKVCKKSDYLAIISKLLMLQTRCLYEMYNDMGSLWGDFRVPPLHRRQARNRAAYISRIEAAPFQATLVVVNDFD